MIIQNEIKKTIPYIIVWKRVKYLEIGLIKKAQDLYTDNYKTLWKKIKEDLNKWKGIPCS